MQIIIYNSQNEEILSGVNSINLKDEITNITIYKGYCTHLFILKRGKISINLQTSIHYIDTIKSLIEIDNNIIQIFHFI
jgi:hypothetical protein